MKAFPTAPESDLEMISVITAGQAGGQPWLQFRVQGAADGTIDGDAEQCNELLLARFKQFYPRSCAALIG